MIFAIIGLVVVLIFVAVGICAICSGLNARNTSQEIGEKNKKINEQALEYLRNQNFTMSHVCYMTDYSAFGDRGNGKKKMLCVDAEHKKLGIIDYVNGSVNIVGFSDFINYEIYEDGKTDTTGSVIFGAIYTDSQENCQEMKIILRFKSYSKPQAEYILISNSLYKFDVAKNSDVYRVIKGDLQQTVSYLEMIMNENKTEQSNAQSSN